MASLQGCKQHSFVLINQQSSQPTLSYRVGVIVFVVDVRRTDAKVRIQNSPTEHIGRGGNCLENVWKVFAPCGAEAETFSAQTETFRKDLSHQAEGYRGRHPPVVGTYADSACIKRLAMAVRRSSTDMRTLGARSGVHSNTGRRYTASALRNRSAVHRG